MAPTPEIQRLCGLAATAALAVVLWTITMILPVNKALANVESAGEGKLQEHGEEERAQRLVKRWQSLHLMRVGLGCVNWTCAVLSLGLL